MNKRSTGSDRAKRPVTGSSPASRNGHSNGTPPRKRATRSKRTALGTNGAAHVEAPKPLPKTTLKPSEIEYFKTRLLEKRRELIGAVDNMENEALRKNRSDASGDLSMMPIHMADIGTDNYEQEFTIGLIAGERETLKEIDAALQRIVEGTYGMCLGTHEAISKARLKAKPWAQYCIEYKRAQEEQSRRRMGR